MLSIKNISLSAGDFCIKNLSLEIADGEYHALLGPSGSGKTVLLNTIAGFQNINEGQIFLEGKEITRAQAEKRNVAYLFQDLALFPHLDVFANIAYPLRTSGMKPEKINELVNEYMDFAQISELRKRKIDKLSGGEKQRTALARILVTKKPLIMLDEPFSAIDSQLKTGLKSLLKKISDTGITIIHVTHDLDEIKGLAKKISIIEKGVIAYSGNYNEIIDSSHSDFISGFRKK